jgi:hypothetical protein
MTTTQLNTPSHSLRSLTSEGRPHRETVGEVGALIDGPPLIFVFVPWLLLGLMLAAPFAVLVTFVVLLIVTTAVVALTGAILAAPFVLVHHLRRHLRRPRPIQAPASIPAAPVVRIEPQHAAA